MKENFHTEKDVIRENQKEAWKEFKRKFYEGKTPEEIKALQKKYNSKYYKTHYEEEFFRRKLWRQKKKINPICRYCKKEFINRSKGNAKYCCPSHFRLARQEYQAKWMENKRKRRRDAKMQIISPVQYSEVSTLPQHVPAN